MAINNNERLIKNTLILYIRMLLIMAVSLFTVRIILNTLGAQDYGIYNIVGGIVAVFSVISGTMAAASQRFFAYEIGRKNDLKLKQYFSLSIIIYIIIILLLLIISETAGLWFLNTQLNIPIVRVKAANWVYQFSILSFIITLLSTPYISIIISREKMKVFAYLAIVESILKLLNAYLIILLPMDKLIAYAAITLIISSIISGIYISYCKKNFDECRFLFFWDQKMFKLLLNYSGWNLFGTLTSVSFEQGINIVLNIFFGPLINTSRALAFQVSNSVNSFSSNFFTAIRPQIIKSFAENNKKHLISLVLKSSVYSYYLLLFISIPILIKTKYIIILWLKNTSSITITFIKLSIIFCLINSLQIPLTAAVQATGKVKTYQITIGLIMISCVPLCYLFLKIGCTVESTYFTMIFISIVALFFRIKILNSIINFSYLTYLKVVIYKITITTIFSYTISYYILNRLSDSFVNLIYNALMSFISSFIIIYFIGLNKLERDYFIKYVKQIFTYSKALEGA